MTSIPEVIRSIECAAVTAATVERGSKQAAVALLVREGVAGDAELLLIRRAERTGDPWSGHLALPGGRVDPGDATLEAAAARETHEEVAIDLAAPRVRALGALPPVHPCIDALPIAEVHPFAWVVPGDAAATPSEAEVAAALWVPVAQLVAVEAATEHRIGDRTFPAIAVGVDTLWGITLRVLDPLLAPTR